MASTRKITWTPIQRGANFFVIWTLYNSPHSWREVSALKSDYVDALPASHSRLALNSRNEPCARQDVGNIVSHIGEWNNAVSRGLLNYDPESHALQITEGGRKEWQRVLARLDGRDPSVFWT